MWRVVGCMHVCLCWMRQWVCVCVWVEKERERKRALANCAASSQQSSADTSSGSRREKGLGWGKKGRERGRGGRQGERRECMYVCVWMCVCERESQGKRNRERHGRTAARISPIAGEGLRGGTGAGILLILSYSRKSCSPARSADYFPCLLPVSSRASGKDRGIRICNHSQQTSTVD